VLRFFVASLSPVDLGWRRHARCIICFFAMLRNILIVRRPRSLSNFTGLLR
jgi:hypothetical protein